MSKERYKTILNLNREIKFLGLSPGVWIILSIALLVLILILKIYFLFLLPLLVYGAFKLEKIQKESTPNYMKSISNYNKQKKSFKDERKFFKYL